MADDTTQIIRIVVDASKAKEGSDEVRNSLDRIKQSTEETNTSLDKLSKSLEDSIGAAATIAKITAAAAGIKALADKFVELYKAGREAATAIDDMSQRLGVSTQFVQASQFAAAQNTVSLEKMTLGFTKASQVIGQAANGQKAAIDIFELLGVKILDSAGKLRSTENVLQDSAAAILKIEDPARRVAVASELFGKQGTALIPMLSALASGASAMALKATAAGAMMDEGAIAKMAKLTANAEEASLKWNALVVNLGADIATDGLQKFNTMLGEIIGQLERGRASGKGFWDTVLNDSRAQGRIGSGPNALRLSTPAEEEADRRAKLQRELADPNNAGRTQMIQEDLDRLNRKSILDSQAEADSQEAWARRFKLPEVSGGGAGVSNPLAKSDGGSSEVDSLEKRIAKMKADAQIALDGAKAVAAAADQGTDAVANLEVHTKNLKEVTDAYIKSQKDGTPLTKEQQAAIAALTGELDKLDLATRRVKALGDWTLQNKSLQDQNDEAAEALRLADQLPEVRARELAVMKAINQAKKDGVPLDSQQVQDRIALLDVQEKIKIKTDEAAKSQELWLQPIKSALSSMQQGLAGFFENMFNGGITTWQSMVQAMKSIFIKMLAELAAVSVLRPVLSGVMGLGVSAGLVSPGVASQLGYGTGSAGTIGGGGTMGIGGMPSFGGLGSGMGSLELPSWLGGGSIGNLMAATPFASAAPAGGFATTEALMASGQAGSSAGWAAGGLGGAVQGLSVGSMLGAGVGIGMGAYSLATSKNTAQTIGGIGQMIGGGMMLIPGMQIPGMVVSALSAILPSLLGGDEYKWAPLSGANVRFDPSASGYQTADTQQLGGKSIAGQYGGVGTTLDAFFKAAGGITDSSKAFGASIWQNQRDGTLSTYEISPTQGSNQLSEGSGDQSAAVDRMIAKVFYNSIQNNAAMNASPTLRTAFTNKEPTSTAAISSLLDLVKAYDQLGKTTGTAETAIKAINDSFATMTAGATEYGLSLAPIQAEQEKQTKRTAQDFIDNMLDPMAVQMRALEDQQKSALASAQYIKDNVEGVYVDMAKIAEYYTKQEAALKAQAFATEISNLQTAIQEMTYGGLSGASPVDTLAGARGTYAATLAQAQGGDRTAIGRLASDATAYASVGKSFYGSSQEYADLIAQVRAALADEMATLQTGGPGTPSAAATEASQAVVQSNLTLSNQVAAQNVTISNLNNQLQDLTAQLQRLAVNMTR